MCTANGDLPAPPSCYIIPGKVTNLTSSVEDGRLLLSWHPSPDHVDRYHIELSTIPVNLSANSTTFQVPGSQSVADIPAPTHGNVLVVVVPESGGHKGSGTQITVNVPTGR